MPARIPSGPSDPVVLKQARRFANEAMFTLDLQWRRVHTDEPEDADFPMRIWSDLYFFIVALQRLRRAATLARRVAAASSGLDRAVDDFDRAVPLLKVMRDVGEHIDDYAQDSSRRRHRTVTHDVLQVAQWDGETYRWLGETLNLVNARMVAQELYDVIRRESTEGAVDEPSIAVLHRTRLRRSFPGTKE